MQVPRLTITSLRRLYQKGQDLLKSGKTQDAAHYFNRIAQARVRPVKGAECIPDEPNPLVAQARLGLCYCFVEQGDLDRAMDQLNRVLSLEPHNPEALCELAYILSLRGQRPGARAALECAIHHNPACARAHKALGYYFLQEDDLERAISECRAAVACDAGYDLAHVELAVALARTGELDQAVDSMSQALQIAPERPDYYYSLAALLRETRRLPDALEVLTSGLELDPENGDMLEAAAEVALETGDMPRAIGCAQKLLRVNRNSLSARDVLGVAYLQQGRINDALRMADQMVAISPLDPSHHFKKAVLFQQQGMLREALNEFVRVIHLAPETDMGEEARSAVEAMDNHQVRQILLLASEDSIFRVKLRRDPVSAVHERGFFLSETGESALQSLNLEELLSAEWCSRPPVYH